MAAACTAMEVHDRRLSISKSSASKISKPSPSPALKGALSASVSMSASPPSSSSSNLPAQLPSSITSSPSRPIAKVVNADPSSFRRVVQELTGTTSSSNSPRTPSRLQRIAPPPLRAAARSAHGDHIPPQQQTLLEQMQHQQASHSMFLLQQHAPKVGTLSPPLSFPDLGTSSSTVMSNRLHQFGNPNPNSVSELPPQLTSANPNSFQSLPMLSPHLLSPLPALTPGDNTWANPIEAISHSPTFVSSSSNDLPPLLPLPNLGIANSGNSYCNALLPRPAYASKGQSDGLLPRTGPSSADISFVSANGQLLPPLLATPLHTTSSGVLPPWSPSPLPFWPASFPPSPGPGLPLATVSSNAQFSYGSANPSMPNHF